MNKQGILIYKILIILIYKAHIYHSTRRDALTSKTRRSGAAGYKLICAR